MPEFLGIDTSNYTTSVAVYDSDNNQLKQNKMILPVKSGQSGLRQNDTVFHHTRQLPMVANDMLNNLTDLKAIGVSSCPRSIEGSYMPCFLSGESCASLLSSVTGVPLFKTSHQLGHITASLYSSQRLDLMHKKFIAFHVSGGTTECLLCTPDNNEILKAELFSSSIDLKAGQAIDRVGIMLGINFPCGKELEKLADESDKMYNIKASMKGINCCLSGVENICRRMLMENEKPCDIAKYCISYIEASISAMSERALHYLGDLPLIYSGGVMSNKFIRKNIESKYSAYFADPEYSCDNAAGIAILSYEMYKRQVQV